MSWQKHKEPHSHNITIVGAGLSGPLLAVFLARRGCVVDIYDGQGDPRRQQVAGGRSINLTIAARGLDALRRVGLKDEVQATLCRRLRHRVVHDRTGKVTHVPYGVGADEVLYSVSRTELTKFLLDVADGEPGVTLHFNHKCEEVDKATTTATFVDPRDRRRSKIQSDVIVGADGVHSVVRRHMHRGEFVDFDQHFVPWRYKELTIDVDDHAGAGGMVADGLHVWPRGDFMMFALPNCDRGFNGGLILPAEGANSFEELGSGRDVREFFETNFPDVVPHMPSLEEEFLTRPAGGFPTIKTSSWHHRDNVVLIGDACHGVIPFYGQGMNAAFEDCVVLDQCLAEHWRSWESAFKAYEQRRRVNTDVLADLSIANFSELRDTVARPSMTARKRVFQVAHRVLGARAAPLYTLVSHTTTPYAECVEIAARRERFARLMGLDVAVAALVATGSLRRAIGRRSTGATPAAAAIAAALAGGAPLDDSLAGAGPLVATPVVVEPVDDPTFGASPVEAMVPAPRPRTLARVAAAT
jgi:kynurenine 3-monooxygenase